MRFRRICFLFCLWAFAASPLGAQSKSNPFVQSKNPLYIEYIRKYKDIAIEHQKKYRIPASITLAQGLIESGAGNSELAKMSNNHFGIKCHNSWEGKKVYHDDDAKGECFRKYKNPKESYEDHALFLTKSPRYASLFKLDIGDYKGWAHGLKRCGYATDKTYASKLIQTIELYGLHRYDGKGMPRLPKNYEFHDMESQWGLPYIVAREGDSPKLIAREFGLYGYQIRQFNDLLRGTKLKEGDIVYLKAKRKKAKKPNTTHTLAAEESLHDVSQQYGIKLKSLMQRNKISSDNTPQPGDVLRLR
ncbi:MAG: glucosaminidase domain-containing protein [Porphyromonadaceae bacterium]|nr:glucosaminidase domain-containing protein [Porphyromonadaceae bacterium]